MKILQINFYDMFSTGHIMLNIARMARLRGYVAYTASKQMKMSTVLHRSDSYHFYIGNRVVNTLHRYFSWITDWQDCASIFPTWRLIKRIDKMKPDIIHLHDVVGWYLNIGILFRYLKKKQIPVVWTFHDCWAFTGRCIYFDAVGCDRWRTGCGDCPQLEYMPKTWWFDRSAWNYRHKRKLFTGLNHLTIVTPSEWLRQLVQDSFMGKYEIKVINNGIDLEVFKPTKGSIYKQLVRTNKKKVLGVAATWSKRKGLHEFMQLAKDLPNDYIIVLVGLNQYEIDLTLKNVICFKRTTKQSELAEIYTAATVFVNPTTEDNFPTVNLEALACGTPVVTYRTGGSPESVDEAVGAVIEQGDYVALKEAIIRQCAKSSSAVSAVCIDKAKRLYNKDDRFNDYIKLYEEIEGV